MVVWVAEAGEGVGEPTWNPVTMSPAKSAACMPLLARNEMVRVRGAIRGLYGFETKRSASRL
jgi:hypothetical protein